MSLTGTVAALRGPSASNLDFWEDLSGLIETLHVFSKIDDLAELLHGNEVVQAILVDGAGLAVEEFVRLTQEAERLVADRDIPLICLVAVSFDKPEALRPDAILTQPVPADTVTAQIRSLIRLKARRTESDVRLAALKDLGIKPPRPVMPVSGGQIDNRPCLMVVGTRGNFSHIEAVLGSKMQIVAALTADMANLYLSWRSFDMVVLDQDNDAAMDTLVLLRANPTFFDLPIILLTEGLDRETTREAYLTRANDVLTLHSTRADLYLRLTAGIRTRRMERQTQEMLLRSQDALESADGTISAEAFRQYLQHAKASAQREHEPLTVGRLTIFPLDDVSNAQRPQITLDKSALRIIRRLVRIEDLAMLVDGTGLITVFPGTPRTDCEITINRISAVLRNTLVTLEIGERPLRLDASAKLSAVNTPA